MRTNIIKTIGSVELKKLSKRAGILYPSLRNFLTRDAGISFYYFEKLCNFLNLTLFDTVYSVEFEGDFRAQLTAHMQERGLTIYATAKLTKVRDEPVNYQNFNRFIKNKKGISFDVFEAVCDFLKLELITKS